MCYLFLLGNAIIKIRAFIIENKFGKSNILCAILFENQIIYIKISILDLYISSNKVFINKNIILLCYIIFF